MTFDRLYEVVRVILGDEKIHGQWYYPDERLDSAIRSVFLLGNGPAGFALTGTEDETITPDVPMGDPYAIVCYEAALLLIGGEDGQVLMKTRAATLRDHGDRKRDLLLLLGQRIYEIRNGMPVFVTFQSLQQFLHSSARSEDYGLPFNFGARSQITLPAAPDINL
jgi:hypothetical protein